MDDNGLDLLGAEAGATKDDATVPMVIFGIAIVAALVAAAWLGIFSKGG